MHASVQYKWHLPPTWQLLMEGGDARISPGVDGVSNKYGCVTNPDPTILAFGSSTASSISLTGFHAAENLHQRLLVSSHNIESQIIYTDELNRIRKELFALCELEHSGADIIFAASGTDLHLIIAQLIRSKNNSSLSIIMPEANETGRGVPSALSGKHFSVHSALGHKVIEGNILDGVGTSDLATVTLRNNDGVPRSADAIDHDIEALVEKAIAQQQRVLLVLVDVSKTGVIAPSIACVEKLYKRFPEYIDVLIDACQFRISNATLNAYLSKDFMVAVTGSKFLTGPTFSGALFIPSTLKNNLYHLPLPQSLAAYSSSAEWPQDWAAAQQLPNTANFGLLHRWEAALAELKAFRQISESDIHFFLNQFCERIQQRLNYDSILLPLSVPQLTRSPVNQIINWDTIQTIFPFILCKPGSNRSIPLSTDETLQIFQLLQKDLSNQITGITDKEKQIAALKCQLGQPVACGLWNGIPVSALRICASSRLIVEAMGNNRRDFSEIMEKALATMDKLALLVHRNACK